MQSEGVITSPYFGVSFLPLRFGKHFGDYLNFNVSLCHAPPTHPRRDHHFLLVALVGQLHPQNPPPSSTLIKCVHFGSPKHHHAQTNSLTGLIQSLYSLVFTYSSGIFILHNFSSKTDRCCDLHNIDRSKCGLDSKLKMTYI